MAYYATQSRVEDIAGVDNVRIAFDVDSDDVIDAGAVERALLLADAYINLRLRNAGLDTPNPLTDDDVTAALQIAAAFRTLGEGAEKRGRVDPDSQLGADVAGWYAKANEYIELVINVLTAEDEDDGATGVGEFGTVTITRHCTSTTDENSA